MFSIKNFQFLQLLATSKFGPNPGTRPHYRHNTSSCRAYKYYLKTSAFFNSGIRLIKGQGHKS